MKTQTRLATLILLGAIPLAGFGADSGSTGAGSTSSPSSATPGTSTGGDTGTMGVPGSSRGATGAAPNFGNFDTNSDGMISRSEARANDDLNSRFDQMDTNRDGQISSAEWQSSQTGGAAGVSGSSRGGSSTETPSGGSSGRSGSSY